MAYRVRIETLEEARKYFGNIPDVGNTITFAVDDEDHFGEKFKEGSKGIVEKVDESGMVVIKAKGKSSDMYYINVTEINRIIE